MKHYTEEQEAVLRRAALASLLLEQRQEEFNRARRTENVISDAEERALADKVREATQGPWHWARNYTKTFNQHWQEQGKTTAYEPFPDWEFFPIVMEELADESERVKIFEKSRDMMVTWIITAYFTFECMLVPKREVIVQTMTDLKGNQVIDYAKHLYQSQPEFLRKKFPLPKPIEKQANNEFLVGSSKMWAIPSGQGKIRSYHPWGVFSDETAFQPEAGIAYDEARAGGVRKIVLNSTVTMSWYWDFCQDAETV